ncbi:MAG: cytidylate kinase-like family protein [Ruminococcaceae bacterium]|nr:cytidylate kinase-like family protein [Oscillospiraceae bacterium]
MKSVITIGRQYGCGGREIGKALSERLGIPFYDKELIEYASTQSGINAEVLEQYDERATNSLLYSLSISSYSYVGTAMNTPQMPLNDQLYISQSDIIKQLADEGPCIILGRCSDYVLRERDDVLNVFLHADIDTRVERISAKLGIPKSKAKELIKKTDKRRAAYYNYYTHQKWGDLKNFDLSINSGVGVEKVVNLIESYFKAE